MGVKEKKSKQMNSNQQQHQNAHFSPFKFAKLVDPDASWDKTGLLNEKFRLLNITIFLAGSIGDVLHWIRQIVALLCGLIWGAIPLIGGIWIVVFLIISSAIIYGYYAMLLKVDEEDFGGHGALLQEGLFASITLFCLRGLWFTVWDIFNGHGLNAAALSFSFLNFSMC